MKKIQIILVAFMMVLNAIAQESAEVVIFSPEYRNLSYHIEVNGFQIPLALYEGGYLSVTVPPGLCYIMVYDGEKNAKIRTEISKERAQRDAIKAITASTFAHSHSTNHLEEARQRHQENVAKGQNMVFGNHSQLSWMQQSNTQHQTGAGKNAVLNKQKSTQKNINVNLSGVKGTEYTALLDKAFGIRVEDGKKYYVKIDGVFETKIELIDKKSKIKKINKTISRNDLSFTGEYNIMNKFTQSPKQSNTNVAQMIETGTSDVDVNIPEFRQQNTNTYVLIVSNEEYQFIDNVNFAVHDGRIFREYCMKTLGIPERQIRYSPNATYGMLADDIEWLKYALNNVEGSKAIVYYCGHGIPDEKTGDAFIIPVDGKGTNTAACYSLNTLYTTLANTKASNITYFMDACFTGANKEGSMLVAARGVAREAKKEVLAGKAVVFSASSGDETAMTYPSKGHGLFTYFLLKKLQETKGNVSYSELAEYISDNVKRESLLINNKPQTPVVATSPSASSIWGNMTLK